jgi:hypothetical protein
MPDDHPPDLNDEPKCPGCGLPQSVCDSMGNTLHHATKEQKPDSEEVLKQRRARVLEHREAFSKRVADLLTEDDVHDPDKRQGVMQALMRTTCVIAVNYGLKPTRLINAFVTEAEVAYDQHERDSVMELLAKALISSTMRSHNERGH